MERVRLRMVRMCQTMPDTLYMVSSSSPKQKSLRRASSQSFPVGGASVSVIDRGSTQAVRDQRKDPSDGNEIHGTQAINLSKCWIQANNYVYLFNVWFSSRIQYFKSYSFKVMLLVGDLQS